MESPEIGDLSAGLHRQRRILAGVDESPASTAAAQWAAELADTRGLELVLVHAWTFPVVESTAAAAAYGDIRDDARDLPRRVQSRLRLRGGVVVRHLVREGTAARVLRELSGSADLIALGQHRPGLGAHGLRGHVARALSVSSRIPVVTVPAYWKARGPRLPVVVGVKARWDTVPLAWAVDSAVELGVSLLVVTVIPTVSDFDVWAAARELAVVGVEEMIAGTRADHPDLRISVQVFQGDAVDVLAHLSEMARLTVVGQSHHPRLLPFGGVTRRLLRSVVSPLLVTPSPPRTVAVRGRSRRASVQ